MLLRHHLLGVIALAMQASTAVAAQTYTDRVWGVFAYTIHGDSTPNALVSEAQPERLTEYGASQLRAAGSTFRRRYVPSSRSSLNSSKAAIRDPSSFFLRPDDVDVFSTTDQSTIASAQAFMLGLRPSLDQSSTSVSETAANGVTYTRPLNGYQFPRIITLGDADPSSLILKGSEKCDMHLAAESEYKYSSEAQAITRETAAFYVDLWWRLLSGVYDVSSATYANAVGISDYLEYEALHNSSIYSWTSENEISRVRWLADRYTYATNAQGGSAFPQSTIGIVNPIAGQTLASSILHAFDLNIQHFGSQQKMTLLFGSDKPAVALASLLGLATKQQPNFFSRPVRGASLVFELYSFETDGTASSYPSVDELFVRFFLHNGTNTSTEFEPFSLFGHGPSRTYIPFAEFRSELETFAVLSAEEWCMRCNSESIFCTGALGNQVISHKKQGMEHGIGPAVAGVIGAVVTLVVIGLLAVVGFLVAGWRKRKGNGRSSSGGFKGNSKLASDTDVSFHNPIWGTSKNAETGQSNGISTGGIVVHGHERSGSWEMGQQRKEVDGIESTTGPHMSEAWDENEEEWRLHSRLQPVKIRESV